MSLPEIFYLLAGLAVIILTLLLVPVLLQLRRTGRQAELLMANLDRELTPLSKSLTDATIEIHHLSNSINNKLDEMEQSIHNFRHASENFLLTSNLVKKTLAPFITQVGGISAGVLAIAHLIRSKHHKS